MPELPEVETVTRQMAPTLETRRILGVEVFDRKLVSTAEDAAFRGALLGARIEKVQRLGKQIVLSVSDSAGKRWHLAVHLRMTGRLFTGKERELRQHKALRALLELDEGALAFCDTRRFGTFRLTQDLDSLKPQGMDPTERNFTLARLSAMLGSSRQMLKPWLLRQDRLVGLGNIYACEILFESGLSPFRLGDSLTKPEQARLHQRIRSVLLRAIRHCGTTFRDFQDSNGEIGSYQQYLRVYAREQEPCTVCGTTIQRVVQQGRSTYYCPTCQPKEPKPV